MAGFIIMDRDWQEHDLFEGDEFSRRDAWHWLICNAAWKPTSVRVAGKKVKLDRGELCFSIRFMAGKWGWSKSRVARFLHELADENMIETRLSSGTVAGQSAGQRAGQSQSVLSICNYDRFQSQGQEGRDSQRDSDAEKAGQSWDKEEQGKQKEDIRTVDFPKPEWADKQSWSDFLVNRRKKRLSNTPSAYKRFLDDIERHSVNGWTPSRLLEHAAAKGWGGIYEPTDDKPSSSDDPDGKYWWAQDDCRAAGAGR